MGTIGGFGDALDVVAIILADEIPPLDGCSALAGLPLGKFGASDVGSSKFNGIDDDVAVGWVTGVLVLTVGLTSVVAAVGADVGVDACIADSVRP